MPGMGCELRRNVRRAERANQLAVEEGRAPKIPRLDPELLAQGDDAAQAMRLVAHRNEILAATPARVWVEVPAIEGLPPEDALKHGDLCRALYEAMKEFGAGDGNDTTCTVSQLGSHYRVQQVKRDRAFKNMRLVDILKSHPRVFQLEEEAGLHPAPGGSSLGVRLDPLAEFALLDLPNMLREKEGLEVAAILPATIEEPKNLEERLQALRIEIVHALHKRGGTVLLNDLGPEPKILKHRVDLIKDRKLLEILRLFPENFTIDDQNHGIYSIQLRAPEVENMTAVHDWARERQQRAMERPEGVGMHHRHFKGGGKSKGKGRISSSCIPVPDFNHMSEVQKQKHSDIIRALHEAWQEMSMDSGFAKASLLGSHWKVSRLKKDKVFDNMRLLDIIKKQRHIFTLRGEIVQLQPQAQEAILALPPGAPPGTVALEAFLGDSVSDLCLPQRIEEPETEEDRLQALRIEAVHAIHKRGGMAVLNDLGQDPAITRHRIGLLKEKKMLELVRVFPENFAAEDRGNGSFSIGLTSTDVADTSTVAAWVRQEHAKLLEAPPGSDGKGEDGAAQPQIGATIARVLLDGKPAGRSAADVVRDRELWSAAVRAAASEPLPPPLEASAEEHRAWAAALASGHAKELGDLTGS